MFSTLLPKLSSHTSGRRVRCMGAVITAYAHAVHGSSHHSLCTCSAWEPPTPTCIPYIKLQVAGCMSVAMYACMDNLNMHGNEVQGLMAAYI
eukprot:365038-Chlamydomonas_euryale.AAC.7